MRKYIISICLGMIFFSSCSNWLDVEPKTMVEEEELFSRELGFKEALTGLYIKMAQSSLYGEDLTIGFMDVLGQRYQNTTSDGYQNALWYSFPSTKTEKYTERIWGNMYNLIANVNNLLYYCDAKKQVLTTENYCEIIKGEALGLRAFLHFDLLRMYGPINCNSATKRIAYRTQFDSEVAVIQPTNVVMDSIIADLKAAEILLTGTDPLNFDFPTKESEEESMAGDRFLTYRHKRMNLYAVKALLARAYLYVGNKTEAKKYANEVISSSYFDLIGDTNDPLRSKEILFSIYVDDFNKDNKLAGHYSIKSEDFFNELFDIDNEGAQDVRVRPGVAFNYSTNGITMKKYEQENLWVSTQGTIVLVRLSEMYYIMAECEDEPADAEVWLNQVRNMRALSPVECTEQNLLDEIEKEYRKEFYGEGQLFYFYKRHGYRTFLHCPLENMTESNYMFSWPENEVLFGQTN